MTTPNGSPLFPWADVEPLPDLRRVRSALDHLPSEPILDALRRRRRNGRNDFPVEAMWRAPIAGVVLQHPTIASLLREMRRNPGLPALCGFEAPPRQTAPVVTLRRNPDTGRMERVEQAKPLRSPVPNAWAFTRFLRNLVELEERRGMLSDLAPQLRRALLRELPDYGAFLGADGKAIRSYSSGRTLKGKRRTSDPDADCGAHAHRGVGRRTGKHWERITSWFGCKLRPIADTQHELPVAFSLEKASAAEQPILLRDLTALLRDEPALAARCREFSADRGCGQEELKRMLREDHAIRPPVDIRMLWREDWDALPRKEGEPRRRPLDPDRVDNVLHTEQGRVSCRCPATGTMRDMAFHGFDAKRNALKHLCPAAAHGLTCEGRAQCCASAGSDPRKLGPSRRIRLNQANRRILPPTPHGAGGWRRGYAKRSALERINARLDDGHRFGIHTIRGKAKMTARVGLALGVMMALALGSVKADARRRMRSLVRAPPKAAAWSQP